MKKYINLNIDKHVVYNWAYAWIMYYKKYELAST